MGLYAREMNENGWHAVCIMICGLSYQLPMRNKNLFKKHMNTFSIKSIFPHLIFPFCKIVRIYLSYCSLILSFVLPGI